MLGKFIVITTTSDDLGTASTTTRGAYGTCMPFFARRTRSHLYGPVLIEVQWSLGNPPKKS
jgi:hypothetical protein